MSDDSNDELPLWVDSHGEFKAYVDSDGDICIENDDLDYDMGFSPEDWELMHEFIAQQLALRMC